MHEAKSVLWVLYQVGCPRYVVEPYGCFCEALYKALITFFIDTTFNRFGPAPGTSTLFADPPGTPPHGGELLRYDCLREYFDCYGGSQLPLVPQVAAAKHGAGAQPGPEAKQAPDEKQQRNRADVSALLREPQARASKVAIAGTLANKRATLANGQQVEVIHPELRGMSFWSTAALFEALDSGKLKGDPDVWSFAARVVSRLYELARNDGKTPQERAINWSATSLLQNVFSLFESEFFRQMLGEKLNPDGTKTSAIQDTAVNDIQVRPAPCQESGGEYDVELSLFNVENTYRGLTVIANTVDVSDVVPVTLGDNRVFNKRS
jgi:hypothetical protein